MDDEFPERPQPAVGDGGSRKAKYLERMEIGQWPQHQRAFEI